MIIYIAGPITGILNYKENFKRVEKELKKRGHAVLNPAMLPTGLKDYMPICIEMINQSDAVIFLDGWEESKGSIIERNHCDLKGNKFIYEEKELYEDDLLEDLYE